MSCQNLCLFNKDEYQKRELSQPLLMSCCEVCEEAVSAQFQLLSGSQGTCLIIYIKIRNGLGISFTF